MKTSTEQKITFHLLEKITLERAMKDGMSFDYNHELYQKHEKELDQPIYLLQISSKTQKWILLKTRTQCSQLFKALYDHKLHQHLNKIVKKIQGIITNIIPHSTKNQFKDKHLIQYLNVLGQKPQMLQNEHFTSFIQYNNVFQRYIYRKFIMIKKNGGRYKEGCCSLGSIWTQWKKRQVNIQYNGITYKNQSGEIKEYLPFSHGFEYFFGKQQTGLTLGVILVSNHRRLVLQTQSIQDYVMFLYLLRKKTQQSPYFNINRFNSFAPPRQFIDSNFYIDGKQYFAALAESISKAKKSIYMTGWMISPEFLLKRDQKKVALFDLIKEKVQQGVQVNILVYHQSSFLPNDSAWVKQKFQSLGRKVKVIRHPTGRLPILWSHHSKMVIVDKEQAFFGGLDLCYGRYDCSQHELFPTNSSDLYPGIQYNNCRIKDIDNVRKFTIDHIDKRQPRLPWHDICQSVKGLIVSDFVHHFVQIWNFASYQNRQVLNKQIINAPTQIQMKTIHNIVSTKQSQIEIKSQQSDQNKKNNNKILAVITGKLQQVKNISKERIHEIKKKLYPQKKKLEELYRKKKLYAASNNFQNYIAEIHRQLSEMQKRKRLFMGEDEKENVMIKSPTKLNNNKLDENNKASLIGSPTKNMNQLRIDDDYMINLKKLQIKSSQDIPEVDEDIDSEEQVPDKIWENRPVHGDQNQGTFQCQLLRSVGNWSIGCSIQKTQFSIHIAYLQLISQAKHYIYIENQFFISSTPQTKDVKNQISNALFRRIRVAIQKRETFKVYVMLPLLPAFAGDVQGGDCTFLRMIMDWHYKTIKNLIQRISELGVNPSDYIQFLGLRTHGVNNQGAPITQIIYVHSKLMIVDDTCTIIGSANINDRSLLGDRDSEIAVATYGTDLVQVKWQGQKTIISKKIQTFRMRLWSEHFQLPLKDLQNPTDYKLWHQIQFIANKNTQIYREIFGCYPDNEMKTIKQLKQIKEKSSLQSYHKRIQQICGNVTVYPYHFLQNEPIPSSVVSKQYYIPRECLI